MFFEIVPTVLLLECLIYLYGKLLIISVGSAIAPFKNVSVGDKIVCLNFGYGVK